MIERPTLKLPALRPVGTTAKRKSSVVVETIRRQRAPSSTNSTEMLDGKTLSGAGGTAITETDVSTDNALELQTSMAPPEEAVTLESHEYANIFPELSDERLAELVQNIRENGLLDKIVLLDGKILDGRGRHQACRMAGVKPAFEIFTGADPLAYVASRNQYRRHLTDGQRAMVAAKIANFRVGANQHSQGLPIGTASELMNVSARSTARAREVLAHGDAALVAAVESGDLTVAAAAALARNPVAAASDNTELNLNSPPALANDGSGPLTEPSPNASTVAEKIIVNAESLPPAASPKSASSRLPNFKLPTPGVTFVVGGLKAAVLEVAIKIAATISAGGEWPDFTRAERGELVWLSSQASAQSFLHPQFVAAGGNRYCVRFLEPAGDDFGLPVRHLSDDLRRLNHTVTEKGPAKGIVLDYLVEYLRFGDTGRAIRSLRRPVEELQKFAVEQGAAVILPCQLPTRVDDAVAEAVTALGSLQAVNAVFLVKRDTKANRGTLLPICKEVSLAASGFPFQLRNYDCVPAVSWNGLPVKISTPIIATVPDSETVK
jgi:hypothetical protein